ncbi:uncharacterized protein BCR38DRAFT_486008 [Pseudomassariella vexata]|uniref:Uncharacterized protein n=1 Tax=Pseudomassariella vexata TaxID=1141098 RepID=A0A1Y2DXA8_9PEZI|nr:uncharacterized protein BCR38DRAFT_486008 [Pseudomassariella vexata]ORY63255.1 hypothetical protein BCR38DRAFT_486008 [Pseudomassariella vexata]
MSVFSIIKRGRQQAKEHQASKAKKTKEEAAKIPYKHVPTHAAIDALSGAPSSWRHDDRPKIMEQNRRRSAMVPSGSGTNLNGMPRVGSSLSYVSYPSAHATPVVPLPMNYSFSSMPASLGVNYTEPDHSSQPGSSRKGKEPESAPTLLTGVAIPLQKSSCRASAMSSKVGSRAGSPGNSSGSDDDLEIRPYNHSVMTYGLQPEPSGERPGRSRQNSSDSVSFHRLHPAHQRRTSGTQPSPVDRTYPPASRSSHFTAPQPVNPHTISSDSMLTPPIPNLPALQFTVSPAISGPTSYASSMASIGVAASTTPSSIVSTPTPTAMTGFPFNEDKPAPVAQLRHKTSKDLLVSDTVEEEQPRQKTKRRLSKTTRFAELESNEYGVQGSVETIKPNTAAAAAATIPELNPAMMHQPAAAKPVAVMVPTTSRRLSKTPEVKVAKESKKVKNWWYSRSSKAPAEVAV